MRGEERRGERKREASNHLLYTHSTPFLCLAYLPASLIIIKINMVDFCMYVYFLNKNKKQRLIHSFIHLFIHSFINININILTIRIKV